MVRVKNSKNSNGQGSISYEADRNQYRAAFTDPEGKRIRRRFKTKQEAEEWLTVVKAEIYSNEYIPKSNYTLGEWVVEYLQTYAKGSVKESTFKNYIIFSKGLEKISNLNLSEIEPYTIQKFFNTEYGYRPGMGKMVYSILSMALKKADELSLIHRNPLRGVRIPKREVKKGGVYTPQEMNIILDALKKAKTKKDVYTIALIAISTGMRLGEIIALKREQISENYISVEGTTVRVLNQLFINTPKSKSGRRKISISKSLYEHIMSLEQHENGYIFVDKNGDLYNSNTVSRTFKSTVTKLDVPYHSFHSLRHTHATWLIDSGEFSIPQISARLGHSTPAITMQVYAHAIPEKDITAPAKIDEMLRVAPTLPPK